MRTVEELQQCITQEWECLDYRVINNVVKQWRTVASLGGEQGGRTAPSDTLHGVTPEGKNLVAEFTKNSGQIRLDR